MVGKEKKDIPLTPVILKFGFALAISLGGILYSVLRSKRNKPPPSKPPLPSPGFGSQANSKGEGDELRNCDRSLQDVSPPRVRSHSSISDLSPNSRCCVDADAFLLPEFNELVKECKISIPTDDVSPRKSKEFVVPEVESPREYDDHDREMSILRRRVNFLEERERNLEIQLLEYYGLKEQDTAVMELQNRVRLNNVEAKLYNLKIESLQLNNRRLEEQVADYAKVVTELEAAKAKIKLLRKKLRSEAEQNREQISALQERVMKMQNEEKKAGETDQDVEIQLQKQRELEEMKKSNHILKLENSELAQKLEYLQMLATSALDNEELIELTKESRRLKQQNEDLTRELERIQADRCTDIEELVYLRWINACLRYELRNYQPGPGKSIARDLSRTLSPRSEERAKQLILEYANKQGSGDKGLNVTDLDCDQWLSSQLSYLTDSGEPDDSSVISPTAAKKNPSGKPKVFAKLMRLLRGKDSHHPLRASSRSPLSRTTSMDDIIGRYSSDSHSTISLAMDAGADGVGKTTRTSSGGSSRLSFDLQRSYSRGQKSTTGESSSCSRRTSDEGTLSIFRRMDSTTEEENSLSPDVQSHQDAQNAGKIELVKYAEALKNTHGRSPFRRRSASVSSF